MKGIRAAILIAAGALTGAAGASEVTDVYTLIIRNHRFEPVEPVIPSGRKVKIVVVNADPTPEEFESNELNREKVIPGNSSATVNVGPLVPSRCMRWAWSLGSQSCAKARRSSCSFMAFPPVDLGAQA